MRIHRKIDPMDSLLNYGYLNLCTVPIYCRKIFVCDLIMKQFNNCIKIMN